ncbi:hypothetical protein AAFC00_005927 [Neodothiora populina]|uniref:WLM domain-containing protein n=1 Tax=Neodothiora populina TaxID=2781224 RepID=A0ABR3P7N6_9PEZI
MSNMNKVLGFERINERRQRPNKLINFIKPREGPDRELAQDFLERVAAICYPIMKANHVVVMSLEEYPSNKEFLGRNFNAGEIIQLVLKTPSGHWYPFKHVQMVMMHELAHCKQMNHSRDFWNVNNANRDELKVLWSKGYTGEGLWGRGQTLLSGRYSNDQMPDTTEAPINLCGGTYRSRGGRKRKKAADSAKPQLSYAERKQRRIAKKFGVNGQALGADGYARFELDQGRHRPSKPRVANSKRGRELRASAALARFGNQAETTQPATSSGDDTDTDSEIEDPNINSDWNENKDVVRICEDENPEDNGSAQREMDELREIDRGSAPKVVSRSSPSIHREPTHASDYIKKEPKDDENDYDVSTDSETAPQATFPANTRPMAPTTIDESTEPPFKSSTASLPTRVHIKSEEQEQSDVHAPSTTKTTTQTSPTPNSTTIPNPSRPNPQSTPNHPTTNPTPTPSTLPPHPTSMYSSTNITNNTTKPTTRPCEICSFANDPSAATCSVCSHVLDVSKIPDSWICHSEACSGSRGSRGSSSSGAGGGASASASGKDDEGGPSYRNLGDFTRCFVCGSRRPGL